MLYVLPYGQISLWGRTVITNLLSAIPWIGQDFVEFLSTIYIFIIYLYLYLFYYLMLQQQTNNYS